MIEKMPLAGELAGLGTAFFWGLSALAWSVAGRQVGAVAVTCLRITLAAAVLSAAHWVLFGAPFPADIPPEAFWLLVVSGGLGAGVGDLCFFRGLVLIGPRLGMLILSLAPFLSALMAYASPLRESLGLWALVGIVLTVVGVVRVVTERRSRQVWQAPPGQFRRGVLMCLAGTVLIAGGLVLAKMGMRAGAGTFATALVRVVAGMMLTWMIVPFLGRLGATVRALRHRRAVAILVAGTIVGPVIGIWLSMEAVNRTAETGVAAALIGTSPIMMIPLAYLTYRERPTRRVLAGTAAAVAGVAVLALRQSLPS